jgi:hypothetical protein
MKKLLILFLLIAQSAYAQFVPVTVSISGTVPLPTGAATSANQLAGLAVGSTTSGSFGRLGLCAVTTAAPTYTTGQNHPCSLDTAGNLRIAGSLSLTGSATPSDTFANPTTAVTGWSLMGAWDGTQWVRARSSAGDSGNTTADTTRTVSALNDPNLGPCTGERYITVGSGDNENEFKSSAGRFCGIVARNTHTANAFIKCSDQVIGSTTPGTTAVWLDVMIPAGTDYQGALTHAAPAGGIPFTTGLTCWVVTGEADTDATDVAANKVSYTLYYR